VRGANRGADKSLALRELTGIGVGEILEAVVIEIGKLLAGLVELGSGKVDGSRDRGIGLDCGVEFGEAGVDGFLSGGSVTTAEKGKRTGGAEVQQGVERRAGGGGGEAVVDTIDQAEGVGGGGAAHAGSGGDARDAEWAERALDGEESVAVETEEQVALREGSVHCVLLHELCELVPKLGGVQLLQLFQQLGCLAVLMRLLLQPALRALRLLLHRLCPPLRYLCTVAAFPAPWMSHITTLWPIERTPSSSCPQSAANRQSFTMSIVNHCRKRTLYAMLMAKILFPAECCIKHTSVNKLFRLFLPPCRTAINCIGFLNASFALLEFITHTNQKRLTT